jgi:capsular polysaccharide biosynthesis protein
MYISYAIVISWLRKNIKLLLAVEFISLIAAGIFLHFTPRVYEANFAVRLPKMEFSVTTDMTKDQGPKNQWTLLISGLDFLRGLQNPMGHSYLLIKTCMGEETNTNRKKFIQGLQISLMGGGDIIYFSLRQEGRERTVQCANLFKNLVFQDLDGIYNSQAQKNAPNVIHLEKAVITEDIHLSDSYIYPNPQKTILAALIAGFLLAIFGVSLRNKYRA